MGTIYEPLPGWNAWVTTGGTRTEVKCRRPWQQPFELLIDPEHCPFCNRGRDEKNALEGVPGGWRLLSNAYTPHRGHLLAIPAQCSSVEKLITLGGIQGIREALSLITMRVASEDAEIVSSAHIGWHAGQNVGHLHWHIYRLITRAPFSGAVYPLKGREDRLVRRFETATVFADGIRSGECLVLPSAGSRTDELPEIISWLIGHCAERFRDPVSGLPPEYSVTFRFGRAGQPRYAAYCPILTQWGAAEVVCAPLEGSPFTLPWPHKVTAKYLR